MKSILLTLMVFSGLIVFADDKNEASQSLNPILIDVRTHAEWNDGHIETAIHIPLEKISNAIEGVIKDKDQVIYPVSYTHLTLPTILLV